MGPLPYPGSRPPVPWRVAHATQGTCAPPPPLLAVLLLRGGKAPSSPSFKQRSKKSSRRRLSRIFHFPPSDAQRSETCHATSTPPRSHHVGYKSKVMPLALAVSVSDFFASSSRWLFFMLCKQTEEVDRRLNSRNMKSEEVRRVGPY